MSYILSDANVVELGVSNGYIAGAVNDYAFHYGNKMEHRHTTDFTGRGFKNTPALKGIQERVMNFADRDGSVDVVSFFAENGKPQYTYVYLLFHIIS